MYDDFSNNHEMLNFAWILIKIVRLSNKCLIFRKNISVQKSNFWGSCTIKNGQN